MPKIYLKYLGEILTEKGMTQAILARKVGCDQSFISKIKRGDQVGTLTLAYRIADALGVPLHRLTGKPAPGPREASGSLPSLAGDGSARLEEDYLRVPIYNVRIVGGAPEVIAREEVVDLALIRRAAIQRKSPRDLVCTHVHGDSMMPILRDGAIVCIDRNARPERNKVPRGSIWAVRRDEGTVVKYLQLAEGAIVLISANPNYPPEVVANGEAIVGRVIWVSQAL